MDVNANTEREWTQKYVGNPHTPPSHSSTSNNVRNFSQEIDNSSASDSLIGSSPTERNSIPRKVLPLRTSSPKTGSSVTSASDTIFTPPSSASPRRNEFHQSNPFSSRRRLFGSIDPETSRPSGGVTPPHSPSLNGLRRAPSVASSAGAPSYRTLPPANHRSNIRRSASARVSDQLVDTSDPQHRSPVLSSNTRSARGPTHARHRSLQERYPGDMSHRPLDVIRQEARTADRAHRGHRHKKSITDTIDKLDTAGGTYHHDGPYEATLASRNVDAKYPPVEAVHDSNMEAIRATPREYIQDSLERHLPLQGTSTIPSGSVDMSGKVMTYEEGADLMREADAPGGAYKRWPGMDYHPDDLKGKGEPSYTFERDEKLKKGLLHPDQRGDFEMQPRPRRRSVGNVEGADASGTSSRYRDHLGEDAGGVDRSNSTGKRLGDGLKRRFGNSRHQKNLSVS